MMRLSPTLSVYLGRQFLLGIATVFAVMLCLILLFDLVELMRRAANRPAATAGIVLTMALLKLPTLSLKVLPFAALLGGMLTFSRLTRTHELVVTRAAGVSVWQFLMPALVIAIVVGGFAISAFNPLASALGARYEQLDSKYLKLRPSLLAVQSSGLWLRQADDEGQSVVHATRVSQNGKELSDVTIFLYDGDDKFSGRIDADAARLRPGHWELDNALLTAPEQPAERRDRYVLPTSLTINQIQESFAAPESLSFWALPRFIDTLERAGFSAVRHRMHWHSLLAVPLLLCAMVLIAATFSLRLTRRGGTGMLIVGGLFAGFLLYVLSDVVYALGLAGNIPVVLAAWSPVGVSALLGLAMLFHLEDG
jgi:lipopolysaccharide export system permease protein